ncbi:MAG: hypothetical protein SGBAC_012502, partial [Bacillariaceae sp.]
FCVLQAHLALGEIEVQDEEAGAPIKNGGGEAEEEASLSDEEEEEEDGVQYFYHGFPDGGDVLEYEKPEGEWDGISPDYIYQPGKVHGIRIVEFYAHCPHCQHFRDHYVRFAQTTRDIVEQYSPGTTINMFAISCVPWKAVCGEFGVDAYPKLFLFKDGSKEGREIDQDDIHPFKILPLLGIHLDDLTRTQEEAKHAESANTFETKAKGSENNNNNGLPQFWLPRTKQDIYNDAHLSFDFAMRNSIFLESNKPLDKASALAFAGWIEQLASAVPPTWALKSCLTEIFKSIGRVVQSEKALLEIVDKYPPPKKKWSRSCTRGDKYAGYTCGLWELFHIMSVGIVEWNVYSNGDDWFFFRPGESATVLRNYIQHFFGCEVCRQNFLHAFDSCDHDRCNRLIPEIGDLEEWKEIPMWLFETHNGVNRRLARERAERDKREITQEEYEAVKWPPRHECPKCWGEDGSWNSENIYNYLRVTYWPDDALNIKIREYVTAPDSTDEDDELEEEVEAGSFFGFLKRLLIAVCGSSTLIYATYCLLRQRRLQRTGRHKKIDSMA